MLKSLKNVIIAILLALAATHCSYSIFYDNTSYLDLVKYENGHAPLPFQARVGMIPLLRYAKQGHLGDHLLRYTQQERPNSYDEEPNSPERAICMVTGTLCMLLLVGALSWFGWRHLRSLWWMPAALTIAAMTISFAARYTQSLWYPYDLPHILFFGLAFLGILTENWVLLCAAFMLDCTMHESAVFVLPCLLVTYLAGKKKTALALAAGLGIYWLGFTTYVHRLFAGNVAETGIHFTHAVHSIDRPHLWPQVASACGYLLIPAFMGRKFLSQKHQVLLWCFVPGILASALFGIWFESRVWAQWCAPLGILITYEFMGWLEQARRQQTSPEPA